MNGNEARLAAFQQAQATLSDALKSAPREQIALLGAVDALYEAMEEAGEILDDAAALDGQVLIKHAESILTRYFGM